MSKLTPAEEGILAAQAEARERINQGDDQPHVSQSHVMRALIEQLSEQVIEDKDLLGMVMDRAGLDPDDDTSYERVNEVAFEFFRIAKKWLNDGGAK